MFDIAMEYGVPNKHFLPFSYLYISSKVKVMCLKRKEKPTKITTAKSLAIVHFHKLYFLSSQPVYLEL